MSRSCSAPRAPHTAQAWWQCVNNPAYKSKPECQAPQKILALHTQLVAQTIALGKARIDLTNAISDQILPKFFPKSPVQKSSSTADVDTLKTQMTTFAKTQEETFAALHAEVLKIIKVPLYKNFTEVFKAAIVEMSALFTMNVGQELLPKDNSNPQCKTNCVFENISECGGNGSFDVGNGTKCNRGNYCKVLPFCGYQQSNCLGRCYNICKATGQPWKGKTPSSPPPASSPCHSQCESSCVDKNISPCGGDGSFDTGGLINCNNPSLCKGSPACGNYKKSCINKCSDFCKNSNKPWGGKKADSQGGSGAQPNTCTYTYSDWGTCQSNGTQSRTYTSSPANCVGTGPAALTQSCQYTVPAQLPCQDKCTTVTCTKDKLSMCNKYSQKPPNTQCSFASRQQSDPVGLSCSNCNNGSICGFPESAACGNATKKCMNTCQKACTPPPPPPPPQRQQYRKGAENGNGGSGKAGWLSRVAQVVDDFLCPNAYAFAQDDEKGSMLYCEKNFPKIFDPSYGEYMPYSLKEVCFSMVNCIADYGFQNCCKDCCLQFKKGCDNPQSITTGWYSCGMSGQLAASPSEWQAKNNAKVIASAQEFYSTCSSSCTSESNVSCPSDSPEPPCPGPKCGCPAGDSKCECQPPGDPKCQCKPGDPDCKKECIPGDPECPKKPVCGDGKVDGGEECDDGGTNDGDGCSAACMKEKSDCNDVPSDQLKDAFNNFGLGGAPFGMGGIIGDAVDTAGKNADEAKKIKESDQNLKMAKSEAPGLLDIAWHDVFKEANAKSGTGAVFDDADEKSFLEIAKYNMDHAQVVDFKELAKKYDIDPTIDVGITTNSGVIYLNGDLFHELTPEKAAATLAHEGAHSALVQAAQSKKLTDAAAKSSLDNAELHHNDYLPAGGIAVGVKESGLKKFNPYWCHVDYGV